MPAVKAASALATLVAEASGEENIYSFSFIPDQLVALRRWDDRQRSPSSARVEGLNVATNILFDRM